MAPVWEANHVSLIFVFTGLWTAYPRAFGSIASTLAVPLFIALLGLVFRDAAYALRAGAATRRESARVGTMLALSSILVPVPLWATVVAIATDRVPRCRVACLIDFVVLAFGAIVVPALDEHAAAR